MHKARRHSPRFVWREWKHVDRCASDETSLLPRGVGSGLRRCHSAPLRGGIFYQTYPPRIMKKLTINYGDILQLGDHMLLYGDSRDRELMASRLHGYSISLIV